MCFPCRAHRKKPDAGVRPLNSNSKAMFAAVGGLRAFFLDFKSRTKTGELFCFLLPSSLTLGACAFHMNFGGSFLPIRRFHQ